MIYEIDGLHHAMITEWGQKKHGFTILPQEYLPEGLICYLDEKPIIAGFMYISTDLTMALIAYVITNPDSFHDERAKCFPELIDAFYKKAKSMNVKFLFTTTNNGSLTNRFVNQGFIECDTDVVHLIKPIQ